MTLVERVIFGAETENNSPVNEEFYQSKTKNLITLTNVSIAYPNP